MSFLIAAFGLCMATLGVIGIVRPERLIGFARSWQTPTGLYAAAAIRIVLGALLLLAAPQARAPNVLRILGVFILVAGLATPLIGLERSHTVIEWWAARGPVFQRAWAGCALVFGLFLVYAVAP
jgi:hypothetical protein